MVKVSIYNNDDGKIYGFRCSGHAGYAEYGQDIVCAAASVLVINAMNSIDTFSSDTFDYNVEEESGTVDFKIVSALSSVSELLLNSLILGLQGIMEEYGQEYIQIIS